MIHLLKQKSKIEWKPKNRKKYEPLPPTYKKLKLQQPVVQESQIVDMNQDPAAIGQKFSKEMNKAMSQ